MKRLVCCIFSAIVFCSVRIFSCAKPELGWTGVDEKRYTRMCWNGHFDYRWTSNGCPLSLGLDDSILVSTLKKNSNANFKIRKLHRRWPNGSKTRGQKNTHNIPSAGATHYNTRQIKNNIWPGRLKSGNAAGVYTLVECNHFRVAFSDTGQGC